MIKIILLITKHIRYFFNFEKTVANDSLKILQRTSFKLSSAEVSGLHELQRSKRIERVLQRMTFAICKLYYFTLANARLFHSGYCKMILFITVRRPEKAASSKVEN